MFIFAFRVMFQNFYISYFGIKRDENYTYYADGTKERNNESTAVWDAPYNSKQPCSATSADFVLMSANCHDADIPQGICEKSVCID